MHREKKSLMLVHTMKRCLFLLLLLAGCAPSSLEDYQREGEALSRKLTADLQKIYTREELAKAVPHLEKQFEKMIDLIIEARLFQIDHPEDASLYDGFESDALRDQLQRIYTIEGGRETIEKAQHEALIRLDAFERNVARQQALGPSRGH